ncbi:hypothetical protein [Pendulispora albinea]|uniref:Peptidase M10 metallopeptidase domain-containing protein n=1 Tax=Pendulispora albinea TaxID=2741071 RepID=A0ABZ2M8Q8_9BACT
MDRPRRFRLPAAWPMLAAFALASLASFAWARPARAADVTFGLAIAVASRDGKPVRDDSWIRAQIEEANRLFAPAQVGFRWTIETRLAAEHTEMHTRKDRDALANAIVDRTTIPIFIVESLEDVDEPGRPRRGVCWKKRYLIVAAYAPPTVLAHELGHFFGNAHSPVTDNLMSYSRSGGDVFLDELQIAAIRASSKRFLASGFLKDMGPPRLYP